MATSADRSGVNSAYGTGVNLRGRGSDATLVLINWRRLAGAGARGAFADLSTLPTAAVERVDILLDGASALYGSDAVGGVVNIILKRDYQGAETRVLAGATTAGEPERLLRDPPGDPEGRPQPSARQDRINRLACVAAQIQGHRPTD